MCASAMLKRAQSTQPPVQCSEGVQEVAGLRSNTGSPCTNACASSRAGEVARQGPEARGGR